MSIINLLGARSQRNVMFRYMMGVFLYATGASRQQISVANHLGYSVSYVTLIGRGMKYRYLLEEQNDKTGISTSNEILTGVGTYRAGILHNLSYSMRRLTYMIAKRGALVVYDNINFMRRVAEQVLGRIGRFP